MVQSDGWAPACLFCFVERIDTLIPFFPASSVRWVDFVGD